MRELKHHLLLENELIGSAYPIYAFVSLILPGVLIDSARTCLNAPGLNTLENKVKLLVLKELKKLWDKEEPDLPWQQGEFSHSNTLLVDDSPYKALRNPVLPFSCSFLLHTQHLPQLLMLTTGLGCIYFTHLTHALSPFDACLLCSRTPPFSLAPTATRTTRTMHWVI